MQIFDYFNFNYAIEHLSLWFQNFKLNDMTNIIKIIVVLFLIIIIWKFIKNFFVAIILAILGFIVYQTYFNVPTNSHVIEKNGTQVEIKNAKSDKLKQDVQNIIEDVIK